MMIDGAKRVLADLKTRFHVHDLRMEAIFREISALFSAANIPLILLKGPHLAHSYYDRPHERPYGDLDILVLPQDFPAAARILEENRFELLENDEDNLATIAQTNHWGFRSRFGQLIELHRGFAGLERHQASLQEWFARAEDFNYGQTPARGLATEDLLCQLCIHIGKSFFYFFERKHIIDLDVVIRKREINWQAFLARCRETKSRAIAYYCLRAVTLQQGTTIPEDVMLKLKPSWLRRVWLERHLDVGKFPIYRHYSKGLEHARRKLTLPLLDGVVAWIPFLARAGGVKSMDILLRVGWVRKVRNWARGERRGEERGDG